MAAVGEVLAVADYGYEPVYAATAASVKAFGIDELDPTARLPDKFEIFGTDMQVLRVFMDAGDKIIAEPGAMIYMSEAVLAGCDSSDCCGRCMSCSPCCMATYEAETSGTYVGLTPVRPAKVVPVPLHGRRFLAKDRAFFASLGQVEINFDVDTNPLTCCCGGQGLVRQVLKGDGMAFIGAMGVITHKVLAPGETLLIDTNSLVSWEDTVEFDVKTTGGFCTCCCAGEGLFNTKLTGPGEVYMQSYSHGKFKNYAIDWYLGQRASGGLQRVANNGGAALGGGPAAAEGIVGALEIDPLDDAPSEFRRRGAAPTVAPADVAPMDRKGR